MLVWHLCLKQKGKKEGSQNYGQSAFNPWEGLCHQILFHPFKGQKDDLAESTEGKFCVASWLPFIRPEDACEQRNNGGL